LYIREYFQRGRGLNEFSYYTNVKIQNGNLSLSPNGNDLDVPTVIHDGLERMDADSDVNLGTGAPKPDDRIVYQPKDTAAICLVDILCAVQPRPS
jgi:hypothetical protein